MKLRLLAVGRLSQAWLQEGAAEYESRIRRYLPLDIVELKEDKSGGRKPDQTVIRRREGEQLLARVPAAAVLVALDERGKSFTSVQLAGLLERHMVGGTGELVLAVGGAWGLDETVRQRADLQLSLSPLTFTHQLARVLLLEQIYRGLTILRNEPYHNA